MDVKTTTNKVVQVATIAGAAVLALKSGQSLLKVKDIKSAAMPVISLLVAVSAFNYAYKSPLKVVK